MLERLSNRLSHSMLFSDLILTMLCLNLASHFRSQLELGKALGTHRVELPWQLYLAVWAIWTVTFLLLTPQRAIFSRSLVEAIGRLIGAISLASLTFAGLLYLTFRDVSRLQFIYFVIINLIALLLLHLLTRSYIYLRHHENWESRLLIVGGGETGQQLIQELTRRPWAGVQIVGYTSDEPMTEIHLPLLGNVDETVQVVIEQRIEEVVFTMPSRQHHRIARISLQLQQHPVMVHMVPGVLDLAFARTSVQALGGIPVISLRESALTDGQRLLKRVFDLLASVFLLLALAPIMLIIALLIKRESKGPIFFMQERIGEHGRHFKMIKFRSMYQYADKQWKEFAHRDNEGHLLHKSNNDPRITRIGHKIRRTSLDELPQLFNVLKGEMSLVGPRPEMPYIAEEYEPWQWQRFRVPPGITGWWQVNGRSDKPMHLHTEEDLYYIQNYSFWLDLVILLKTVVVVWRGQGAY
jgi:exopolysaccharide biosynthesis polyprenyl glycosylphosphotransferase